MENFEVMFHKSYTYLEGQNMLFKYHGFKFSVMTNRLKNIFKEQSFISDKVI